MDRNPSGNCYCPVSIAMSRTEIDWHPSINDNLDAKPEKNYGSSGQNRTVFRLKKASGMRSEPANPVDGRDCTPGRAAGSDRFDHASLRCFSPVKRMCKPVGIRSTDQTSIGSRLRSNRPSCRSISVKSKVGAMPVIDDKILR